MLTTFLPYTCLTEPVYSFEEGEWLLCLTLEKCSATHLHFWTIAKPVLLKQLFNSESCSQHFPFVSCLKSKLSNLSLVIPFHQKHPETQPNSPPLSLCLSCYDCLECLLPQSPLRTQLQGSPVTGTFSILVFTY